MPNQKHLRILRQGVEVWNKWREENPYIKPDLEMADLRRMDLFGVNFRGIVRTPVENTTFTGCLIYGISTWDLQGEPKDQSNLVISFKGEPKITVDTIEVAQFIYLCFALSNSRYSRKNG